MILAATGYLEAALTRDIMDPDLLMERIEAAIAAPQEGRKDTARQLLADLWKEIGPAGDPLCRCRLAHHMADLQDDPRNSRGTFARWRPRLC